MLRVKEVSRQLGLNPQTLYFYERIGMIRPLPRTQAGYRLFSPQDVERLTFIIHAKTLGLSLDEIRDVLSLKENGSLTCQAVYERLGQKIQDIRIQIDKLQRLHDDLMPLMQQCEARLTHPDPAQPCVALEQPHSPHQSASQPNS